MAYPPSSMQVAALASSPATTSTAPSPATHRRRPSARTRSVARSSFAPTNPRRAPCRCFRPTRPFPLLGPKPPPLTWRSARAVILPKRPQPTLREHFRDAIVLGSAHKLYLRCIIDCLLCQARLYDDGGRVWSVGGVAGRRAQHVQFYVSQRTTLAGLGEPLTIAGRPHAGLHERGPRDFLEPLGGERRACRSGSGNRGRTRRLSYSCKHKWNCSRRRDPAPAGVSKGGRVMRGGGGDARS